MKTPKNLIDRFCYNHPNFGIDNVMLYVAIGNAVFWVLSLINPVLMSYLAFSPYHILHGQVWRLLTFALYPPSTGILALITIYFYYWIGNVLERNWGTGQFTLFLLTGILLTAVYGFIIYFLTGISVQLTAEWLYMSMFFSFATLFPDTQVLLYFIVPIKIKWLAWVDVAFFVISIFSNPFPINLLPVIAMLNYVIYCGSDLFRFLPRKKSSTTVNFKKEAARIRYEQRQNLYNHKCAVCGRTDTDYPNLQFRYCSRCAGYHCFCEDHINNHIHFTE